MPATEVAVGVQVQRAPADVVLRPRQLAMTCMRPPGLAAHLMPAAERQLAVPAVPAAKLGRHLALARPAPAEPPWLLARQEPQPQPPAKVLAALPHRPLLMQTWTLRSEFSQFTLRTECGPKLSWASMAILHSLGDNQKGLLCICSTEVRRLDTECTEVLHKIVHGGQRTWTMNSWYHAQLCKAPPLAKHQLVLGSPPDKTWQSDWLKA